MGGDGLRNDFSGSAAQVVQADHVGSVTFAAPSIPSVVPAQVPAPPDGFVDRVEERKWLSDLASRALPSRSRPVVGVVGGMRGVGKTALLRMAAVELTDRFPDGSLHVVFGPDGQSPAAAAARLLVGLGVPESCVPSDFDRRVDLLRSLTAKSRTLMVFDDVTEAAQVIALLPNSGACLVLVAGNTALTELHEDGAELLTLVPLSVEYGVELLARICPDGRISEAPDDAAALVELCGALPLALRIAGAHLAVRRQWSVLRLVEELRAAARNASGNGSGVLDRVYAVFDTVYRELPRHLRRLYRMLGVLVGVDFGAEVLAAMGDRPVAEVLDDLDELCLTGMVEQRPDGGYGLHRLVRGHALRMSQAEDSDASRVEMLRRAVDWWLLGATAADVAIAGWQRLRITDPRRFLGATPVEFSPRAGLDWFEREHLNIVAAAEAAAGLGWHDQVWQLFEATFAYFDARRPLASWIRLGRLAIGAAELARNRAAEARCRCLLGKAYQESERYAEAQAQLDKARELAQDGDELVVASTFDFTGNLALRRGRADDALGWFRAALDINIRLGTGRGTAMQTLFVGRALAALGSTEEAIATFASARSLAEVADAQTLIPKILLDSAEAYLAAGQLDEAQRALADAHDLAARLGLTAVEAEVAKHRGTLAERRGDTGAADTYRRQAAAAYERMGSPRAARLLAGLTGPESATAH